jgi:hypothetical protein
LRSSVGVEIELTIGEANRPNIVVRVEVERNADERAKRVRSGTTSEARSEGELPR